MSESRRVIADVRLHPYRQLVNWDGSYEVEQLSPSAWYKADAITGKDDGNAVTTWLDSSGNGRTLTGTATYRRSPYSSRPWLEFNGTSDGLQSAVELSAVLGAGMIGTVFFVYANAKDGTMWSQSGGFRKSASVGLFLRAWVNDAGGPDTIDAIAPIIPYLPSLGIWRYGPAGVTAGSFNNQADDTGTVNSGAQTSTTGTYYVGSQNAAGFFTGKIAEVIVFATDLTLDQRERVAAYLSLKYDLPEACVRPRIRWRTPFAKTDTTVSGFVPPLSVYRVHLNTNPVEKLLPPPYRADLSVLSLTELATEAASIGAMGDSQYFVDDVNGYLYLTLYQDPSILSTAANYTDPPPVFAEYVFLTASDTAAAGVPNLFVQALPVISSEDTGAKVNGSIILRDVMSWFTLALRKYIWSGTRVDITLSSFDGTTLASSIVAPCYVDDVIPNEGSAAITLKSIMAETPIDLQSPWPPNVYTSLAWPFASSEVAGNAIQLGYNPVRTAYSALTVTPDLVAEREATPMDIVANGDYCRWIDPAVLSGELSDGDEVRSIINKARPSYPWDGGPQRDYMYALNDYGPAAKRRYPIIYKENVLNGYPALHFGGFGGGADQFSLAASEESVRSTYLRTGFAQTINNRLLVFILFKAEDQPSAVYLNSWQAQLFESDNTGGSFVGKRNTLRLNSALVLASIWLDNAGAPHSAVATSTVRLGDWILACYQMDRAALFVRNGINDADTAALVSTAATSAESDTAHFNIGRSFRGYIAEVVICDGTSGTDYTEAKRRQIASYFRNKYALMDEHTTAPAFTTYGTYQVADGGRADGTAAYVAFSSAAFDFGTVVYGVNKKTGVRTRLAILTDYVVRSAFISVVNATYASSDYYLEVSLSDVDDPALDPFSPASSFAKVWLNSALASGISLILTNAPIWANQRTTLQGMLYGGAGQAGIFPTLMAGSVANAAYVIDQFQPDPTAAADGSYYKAPTLRREDCAQFVFSGKVQTKLAGVLLYHSPAFGQGGTIAWKTTSQGKGGPVTEVYTFIQEGLASHEYRGFAFCRVQALPRMNPAMLAGRHLLTNGPDRFLFDVRTRTLSMFDGQTNLFAPGLLLGQPVLLTFSPYPNSDGAATAKVMTVERAELQFWPPQLGLTLSDRRGLDGRVGGWVSATLKWANATSADKQVSGFWTDQNGAVDSSDEATRGVSVWY